MCSEGKIDEGNLFLIFLNLCHIFNVVHIFFPSFILHKHTERRTHTIPGTSIGRTGLNI